MFLSTCVVVKQIQWDDKDILFFSLLILIFAEMVDLLRSLLLICVVNLMFLLCCVKK